jgi:hypothetical protein
VSTWSALPPSGNLLGQRAKVSDGLGLCVAVWDGTAWRVSPDADTGWLRWSSFANGWTAQGGYAYLRRNGMVVRMYADLTFPATWNGIVRANAFPGFGVSPGLSGWSAQQLRSTLITTESGVPRTANAMAVGPAAGFWFRILGAAITSSRSIGQLDYYTDDAWPTVAPA